MTICDHCGRHIEKIRHSKTTIIRGDPERIESNTIFKSGSFDLPFTCNYCNGKFCSDHRLPERHDCPKFSKHRISRTKKSNEEIHTDMKRVRPPILNNEKNNLPEMSERKPIYIWLIALTIGIIGVGLYATGNLDGIIGLLEQKEDFTTYIESDTSNQLSNTQYTSRFTSLNRLAKNTYLYSPFEYKDEFTHKFKFYITSIDATSDKYLRVNLISYTESLGDFKKIFDDRKSQIFISVGCQEKNKFFLVLGEHVNGEAKGSERSVLLDIHTEYEVSIQREMEHFTIKILDEGREIEEISYYLQLSHVINYIMCPQSLGYQNGDLESSGVISNLIL